MYKVVYSKRYRKKLKRLSGSGRFNIEKLDAVVETIAKGEVLPSCCRNHRLEGIGEDVWECHIAPDLLLVYEKYEAALVLYLLRIDSHSDLFG